MTQLSAKGFKILNRMNRKMPDYLSPVWQGFDEPTTDECLLGENFSIYLNPKHLGIGAGVGALAGLSYGYWDYHDAKKQAAKKGLQKPNKKKILIRDTLIGLGLGTAASPLATMFLNTLENKRVTEEQKNTFDKLEQDILKGHDKNKLMAHLNNYKNKLAPDQYNTLKTLVDAHTEPKKNEHKNFPNRLMSYRERIEMLEDSLPIPIAKNGIPDYEAIKEIKSALSPKEYASYLNKFGLKVQDIEKGLDAQEYRDKEFKKWEKIEEDAKIAKQQPTIVPDTAAIRDPIFENNAPASKEEIESAKKDIDAEYEIDKLRIESTGSRAYDKQQSNKIKNIKKDFDKARSKVSKTTSDLADALFGAYFSNKAQIFRNYNAQKKRW